MELRLYLAHLQTRQEEIRGYLQLQGTRLEAALLPGGVMTLGRFEFGLPAYIRFRGSAIETGETADGPWESASEAVLTQAVGVLRLYDPRTYGEILDAHVARRLTVRIDKEPIKPDRPEIILDMRYRLGDLLRAVNLVPLSTAVVLTEFGLDEYTSRLTLSQRGVAVHVSTHLPSRGDDGPGTLSEGVATFQIPEPAQSELVVVSADNSSEREALTTTR